MERWDLFDSKGQPLKRTVRRGERLHAGEYHKVVHIWVVNSVGRVLVQLRSPRRKLMPNIWAVTSGSVVAGEDSLSAACRELQEELGISLPASDFVRLGRLVRRNSLCDVWLVCKDITVPDMRLQREEVAQARWVTVPQLVTMLRERRFHHYGAAYFRFVFDAIARVIGTDLAEGEDFKCLSKS